MADPLELIIFDCDGVLVDSERIAVPIDRVVLAELGWNIPELLERIEAMLERQYQRVRVRIPYDQAALVDLFHRKGTIATERHTDKGTLITGSLPTRFAGPFRRYAVR